MSAFEIVHQDRLTGKLTCFDRLIFKGQVTRFYQRGGMKAFLDSQKILFKDFASYVQKMSGVLQVHAKPSAEAAGRPKPYLSKAHTRASGTSKEDLARQIAGRDKVTSGLICVRAAVETCMAFDIHKNAETHRLEVVRRKRACLSYYYYLFHEELGFCHVRIQSWFPFEVQIWVNVLAAARSEHQSARVGVHRAAAW